MFCPKCGCELQNKAKFCHKCGQAVNAPVSAPAPVYIGTQAGIQQNAVYTKTAKTKKIKKITAITVPIVAVCVVLAIILGSVSIMFINNKMISGKYNIYCSNESGDIRIIKKDSLFAKKGTFTDYYEKDYPDKYCKIGVWEMNDDIITFTSEYGSISYKVYNNLLIYLRDDKNVPDDYYFTIPNGKTFNAKFGRYTFDKDGSCTIKYYGEEEHRQYYRYENKIYISYFEFFADSSSNEKLPERNGFRARFFIYEKNHIAHYSDVIEKTTYFF